MRPLFRGLAGLIPVVLAGCSSPQPVSKGGVLAGGLQFPPDGLGREIKLTRLPHRVAVIGPGALETVYALGAQNLLVARDQIADYPKSSASLPVAGDFRGPYTEKMAALKPELVIIQGETWNEARVEQWQREIGAPVVALTSRDLTGLAQDIERIGRYLGREPLALPLAEKLRRAAAYRPAPAAPSAFVEVQRSPLWSAGTGTLVGEVLRAGGFKNHAADLGLGGYGPFGLESLLARQPDFYLVTSRQPEKVVLQDLRGTPVISKLKCVTKGSVLVVDGDLILRPGPRLLQGIEQLRARSAAAGSGAGAK